ncbi:VOC family protein [Paenibacillus planticolens]|uniref:VOC family protein n=1 Tax=Paenibacillus planticolens TaxID=2654976 RepID=A0ABX1ZLW7_9BACL|nr:VOC family protein [Paenibacillus planticolens]NOV00020.1 VOC family protein [Paenibacillus planticolens]
MNESQVLQTDNRTITPWITTKSTEKLISFLIAAFNAEELGRVYNPDGNIGHAEVRIGDSKILMFDSLDEWPAFPCLIRLYVENADELYSQAIKAGAISMTKPTTMAWGERGGRVVDPFGSIWWITSKVEDVSPEEMMERLKQQEYIDAMEYAQKSFNPFMAKVINS